MCSRGFSGLLQLWNPLYVLAAVVQSTHSAVSYGHDILASSDGLIGQPQPMDTFMASLVWRIRLALPREKERGGHERRGVGRELCCSRVWPDSVPTWHSHGSHPRWRSVPSNNESMSWLL